MSDSGINTTEAIHRPDEGRDEIPFPAGTLVKIDGLPFWLASDVALLGNGANLELIR